MNDMKHWLEESSDADEFERAVLRSGLDADPPREKQAEVWAAMVGALGVAPLVAASRALPAPSVLKPVAATAKTSGLAVTKLTFVVGGLVKGLLLGLAVYGVGAGVSALAERGRARETTTQVRVASGAGHASVRAVAPERDGTTAQSVVTVASAPVAVPPSASPSIHLNSPPVEVVASAALSSPQAEPGSESKAVAAFGDAEAAPNRAQAIHESQLKAEASALRDARAELRAGRLANAYALLEASQRQFSVPELYQEREALMIELLSRSGQAGAAAQRAKAFLARFPESPHAAQIQPLAGPP